MKFIILLSALFIVLPGSGQVQWKKIDHNAIPKTIRYPGNFLKGFKWTDKVGENILILSATGERKSKKAGDDDNRESFIYAYHYLVADSAVLNWKLTDFITDCPVDIELSFIDKAFAITDLDKDNTAEIWLIYKVSCHGDVSPIPMKLIMYEDAKKFAMRGTTKVKVSEKGYQGGEYKFDEAFQKASAVFRQYAKKVWEEHKVTSSD